MNTDRPLVRMDDLAKHFPVGRGRAISAVDGVTLDVARGETLGLVGESGCGKTTLGRLVCRLQDPTRGQLHFDDVDLLSLPPRQLRRFRPRMQMIFQDPVSSLNPHRTIAQTLALPLSINAVRSKADLRDRVSELLQLVGLDQSFAHRFPHQLSGGQRQRVGIARAIACEPDLIVADEPVASLDVSIQAQILEILRHLQQRFRAATMFISHDVSVVSYVSQRIAVMYLGRIVEVGPAERVTRQPLHPYTRALLAAVPRIERDAGRAPVSLSGDPPSPMAVPGGCRFHTRCYLDLLPECLSVDPPLRQVGPRHFAACHLAGECDGD